MKFKVVIDTNIFISGIFWSGTPGKILEYFKESKFELLVTKEIINEYRKKLKEIGKKIGKEEKTEDWLKIILEKSILIKSSKGIKLCRDKKDNIFLECAISGRAKYIVTRDDDLKRDLQLMSIMKRKYDVEILSVSQFIKLFE